MISQTASIRDDGKIIIEEIWDTNHPASPFVILNPFPHGRVYRWRIMSKQEYEELWGKMISSPRDMR
jgi:hypothetical protein